MVASIKRVNKAFPLILSLLFCLLTWVVSKNSFFWDTVQLGSKQAHWFYDNNFSFLILPNAFDSGHPPLLGIYLAFIWKIFGKTLQVSHFAMLPFLIGISFQLCKIIARFFKPENVILVAILLVCDATFLAQATLVSPDIILIFFFLLSLNAILSDNRKFLSLALVGLGLISMRGMYTCFALYLFDSWIYRKVGLKQFLLNSIAYVPVVLLVGVFLIYHYLKTGWIGYHANSPWAVSFEIVSFSQGLKNLLILGWRLIDFGRIIWWLIILFCFIKYKAQLFNAEQSRVLFVLFSLLLIIFSPTLIIYSGLLAHRYLLPVYIAFSLLVCYIVFENNFIQKKKTLFILILAFLLSGNFWVYPDKIAKGWDSTMAHLPYYELRKNMLVYIKNQQIPIDSISSEFPLCIAFKYVDLSADTSQIKEKDFSAQYLIYSNIFNHFTDGEIDELKQNWVPIKEFRKGQVYMILYRNPRSPN
jgi:hypothetical protein